MELYCRSVNIFDKKIVDEFFLECKNNGMDVVPGDCSLILGKTYYKYKNFYYWYKAISKLDTETRLTKKQVGCTCFLVFDKENDNLIGMFDLRHSLNYTNGNYLGHIGVTIRPSFRNRGLYKDLLELIILECKYYLINPIVIACEYDNIYSKRGIDELFGDGELVLLDGSYIYVYKKYI